MTTFTECLADTEKLAAGLASLELTSKQRADLELLYASPQGLPVTRDSGWRVRGETVQTSSGIGKHLTSHFGGHTTSGFDVMGRPPRAGARWYRAMGTARSAAIGT